MFGWWEIVGPMPLNKNNTKGFHRLLYAGQLEEVRLLKREPNLRASVVTNHKLFDCWWNELTKDGEQLDNDVTTNHKRMLYIPTEELERVGVNYINPLDVFVDEQNRYWQPESPNTIEMKMWENHIAIECRRTEPKQ